MKELEKETKSHKCGCFFKKETSIVTLEPEGKYKKAVEIEQVKWSLSIPCKKHAPDFQKKANRIMRKKLRKRGKGYTKSDKKKRG